MTWVKLALFAVDAASSDVKKLGMTPNSAVDATRICQHPHSSPHKLGKNHEGKHTVVH